MKDQSRNWQKHFLRVEQERCAQSSRIDELLTLQVSSYTGSCSDASPLPDKAMQMNQSTPLKRRRDIPRVDSPEEKPQPPIGVRQRNPSSSKQKNRGNDPNVAAISSSSHRRDPQNTPSHTTLIRRVQAVVRIKREESDDASAAGKDEASDEDEDEDSRAIPSQRHPSRRSFEKFIVDDEENPVRESMNLRHRNGIINYREEDEDEDDVDELMIGAEVQLIWIGLFFACRLTYDFRVMRSLVPNFQNHRHHEHPRKGVKWLNDDRGLAFIYLF